MKTTEIGIKEHPIIFSGDMVLAILDGRKTQTRRVVKLPSDARETKYWTTPSGRPQPGYADPGVNYWTEGGNHLDKCPYGVPGDRLWVREEHAFCPKDFKDTNGIIYRADGKYNDYVASHEWRPSIHMFKKDSRIWRDNKAVRAEWLQDISEEDAISEGFQDKEEFKGYWELKNEKRGFGWEVNPCVFVVGF